MISVMSAVSPKERLSRTLNGETPDRAPCICPGGMMNMVTDDIMSREGVYLPEAHTDAELMAVLARGAYRNGCFENYGLPFCMTVEAEAMGAKVDLGSRLYEPRVKDYAIGSVSEWRKLKPLQKDEGRVRVTLDAVRILKERGDDVPIIGNLTGPISVATQLLEPMIFYKELRKNKKESAEFLDYVTDQLLAFASWQIEAGIDVLTIADPSGTGEILGPANFSEYVVPRINRLLDLAGSKGVPTITHICGQTRSIYEPLSRLRSGALSFDSVVPMAEARRALGDRVLMGNVSTYAMEFGKPDRIRLLAGKCLSEGADILSPACGLGARSPLANTRAVLDAARKRNKGVLDGNG